MKHEMLTAESAQIKCPLCGEKDVSLLAHRIDVPVLQNVICATSNEARQIPKSDIKLVQCHSCEFVFNASYRQVDYDADYENFQGCSPLFSDYLDAEAKHIAAYVNALNGDVLLIEVGCGQGDFLQNVIRRISSDHKVCGIGFDPAYHGERRKENCFFLSEYFSGNINIGSYVGRDYGHVICIARHVIEHIADPHFLVSECAKLKAKTVDLFLETPDVRWIERNEAFEDIVYEHCSFFNPVSLAYLMREHGFAVEEFRHTFGGQYMWMAARKSLDAQGLNRRYRMHEEEMQAKWEKVLSSDGVFFVWGAGAKGVAFLNLLDPECKMVKGVIDINPKKQGGFLAGTGHPIYAPTVLQQTQETMRLIVMNENYVQEIAALLEKMNVTNAKLMTLRQ